ncbi:MAG TPA: protein-L-isoaspartate(D-aspartate) O-methyltransferase [Polyangiales bacterium]
MRTPWRRERCLTHVAGTAALLSSMACTNGGQTANRSALERPVEPQPTDSRARERDSMVERQLAARGILDERVLAAMRSVPRHEFVPEAGRGQAYADHPLEIGFDQTISQPYIVARMSELARVGPNDKVLEVGTGSGYQAAVLAELARDVYSIEIVAPLARRAAETLTRLGHRNVAVRAGDGYRGWPEQAPFDAIVVTAAPAHVPEPLKQQLAQGGRLVIPVGTGDQELLLLTRRGDHFETARVLAVRFVPMTGAAERE